MYWMVVQVMILLIFKYHELTRIHQRRTLVLAGLSSVGLEYDDGPDADSLPDYTGIDLNKLVSVKKTWTYTDESGNQVEEEGWRENRLESIEAIDLRDSQSAVNKAYNEDKLDTIGFDNSNKSTLTDADGAVHSLYTSASGSILSAG